MKFSNGDKSYGYSDIDRTFGPFSYREYTPIFLILRELKKKCWIEIYVVWYFIDIDSYIGTNSMPLILWTSDLSKSIKISLHFTFKKISFWWSDKTNIMKLARLDEVADLRNKKSVKSRHWPEVFLDHFLLARFIIPSSHSKPAEKGSNIRLLKFSYYLRSSRGHLKVILLTWLHMHWSLIRKKWLQKQSCSSY